MNALAQKLNGKKRLIAGGTGIIIGMPFLVSFLINMNSTVVATETQVKTNTKQIEHLDKLPAQVAVVQTHVENIREKLEKQETFNGKMDDKTDEILKAIYESRKTNP